MCSKFSGGSVCIAIHAHVHNSRTAGVRIGLLLPSSAEFWVREMQKLMHVQSMQHSSFNIHGQRSWNILKREVTQGLNESREEREGGLEGRLTYDAVAGVVRRTDSGHRNFRQLSTAVIDTECQAGYTPVKAWYTS